MIWQRHGFACLALALLAPIGGADPAAPAKERKIAREPAYQQARQQYLLLLLGQKPTREIWIVRDGYDFYLDRNANGDLTDAGEKVTAGKPALGSYFNVDFGMLRDGHGKMHGPLQILVTTDVAGECRVTMPIANKFTQIAYFVPARTQSGSACVLHFDGPLSCSFLGSMNSRLVPVHRPEAFTLSRSKGRYLASWVGTQVKDSPAVHCAHSPVPEDDPKGPRVKIVYDHRDPQKPAIVESLLLKSETPVRYSRRGVKAPMNSGTKARITLAYPSLAGVPDYAIEVKVID